jgi:hypothetical protein
MSCRALRSLGLPKLCTSENLKDRVRSGGLKEAQIPVESMAVEAEDDEGARQEGIWEFVLADVREKRIGHDKGGVPKRKC